MKRLFTLISLACLLLPTTLSAKKQVTVINVIPYPQSVEIGKGSFKAAGANFNCDQNIDAKSQKAIKEFADKITFISGRTCSFAVPLGLAGSISNGKMKGFIFLKDESLAPEEYSINIQKKSCLVKASSNAGFLYAIATLKQLTSTSIFGTAVNPNEKFFFPCVKIQDKPRFAYRGMHLDCSRHFFSVQEVKKYLDVMALHKLNRFHWHLTDDQGWRVEIKKYPRLTEVGAFRNGTVIKKDWNSNDGIRYGGYYTQEQMRDIVAYADNLGITVIPEIDLPGHMMGALAAYPELGCTGGPYEVWTRWGVSGQVLCPGKEAMFTFLENVFTELMDIFPSEYIHIGGDECPKERWQKCPKCQAKIKELGLTAENVKVEGDGGRGSQDGRSAENKLQSYINQEIEQFLASKGRSLIGWDEILAGGLTEDAIVMSWRGTKGGVAAAKQKHRVIMSPNVYAYIDHPQLADLSKSPRTTDSYVVSCSKMYSFEPLVPEELTKEEGDCILGVQANLWTEHVAYPEHALYQLLPRLASMSEVQWCNPEQKDFEDWKKRLPQLKKLYGKMGVVYCNEVE